MTYGLQTFKKIKYFVIRTGNSFIPTVIAASEASGIIFLTALDLKIFVIRDDLLNPQCIGQ